MNVNVGDRIVVESETVGESPREGEVLDIVEGAEPLYRIRWSDGHESTLAPTAGSVRVAPR